MEPFSRIKGFAHTFLTFGFAETDEFRYLSISIEARREKVERFSALLAFFPVYEIIYVFADEQDVIKLRSNYRHDPVYLYPMKLREEQVQTLFLSMVKRANKLQDHPEFYNAIANTCTTNVIDHVNELFEEKISWEPRILFPGYSDQLFYDLKLIPTNYSFKETREKHQINALAEQYADSTDFSLKIRSGR